MRESIRGVLQQLREGYRDPNIFKAIFMAGGPGAGKGFFSSRLGISREFAYSPDRSDSAEEIYQSIYGDDPSSAVLGVGTSLGLKVVNIDNLSSYMNHMAGYGIDYGKLQGDPDLYAASMATREAARSKFKRQFDLWVTGRLGLVIDQTSTNPDKVIMQKSALEAVGYDTMLVAINIPLEAAIRNNEERKARGKQSVAEDVLRQIHGEFVAGLERLKSVFGSSCVIIENDGRTMPNLGAADSAIRQFLNKPITNPIAREWLDLESTIAVDYGG